jgi:alpha-ketoglutarate-dependent taurine dioxygenase
MARTLDIEPIDASFGAVVKGIKVAELDDGAWRELYDAWLQYALLIFPDQHLKRDQQIAFARRFGPLEFEMAAISNVKADGTLRLEKDNDDMMKVLKGNMGWHCDSTYMPVQAKGAVFSAEVVPSIGGRTGFADMRAAWDALDDALKAGLSSHHHCCTTAKPSWSRRRRRMASIAATACTTGRCRSDSWSRPIPRPAANRC